MTKSNRCTGHCCTALWFPFGPEQLLDAYERWKASGSKPIYKCGIEPNRESMTVYQDIHLVAPMLTYLGFLKKPPCKMVNPTNDDLLGKRKGAHYYSCKHFDHKKKICTIYEIRPQMCRGYPYGKKCNYTGCTWKSHKAKKETRGELARRLRELRDPDKFGLEFKKKD